MLESLRRGHVGTLLLVALAAAGISCASGPAGDGTGSSTSPSNSGGAGGPPTAGGSGQGTSGGANGTPGGGGGAGGGRTNNGAGGAAGAGSGNPGGGTGGSASSDAQGPVDANLPDVPLPECNYPDWTKAAQYHIGDVVMYMGKPYVALHDSVSLDPIISTYYWGPFTGCKPPPPPPAAVCPFLDKLLPDGEATFTQMFTPSFQGWVPLAAYNYTSLCKALATAALAPFARSGDDTKDKRELAAFFANVAIETAYLTYVDESGHKASDRDFHGRGALQITGQPIYSEAGAFLGLDLAGQPQLASEATAVWQTGIWYWTFHSNPSVGGSGVCHAVIGQGNFGQTVRIIKGNCSSAAMRAAQYKKNCMLLGVDPGDVTCQ